MYPPDHLHDVWQLPVDDADFSSWWSRIKSGFSRKLPAGIRSARTEAKREKGIWQRRFWESQIRDERDMRKHVDYIHFNPVKHRLVQRVAGWPYSSFHRHVAAGTLSPDWADQADDIGVDGEPG